MKIGMVTDSLANLGFSEMLRGAAELGLETVEFATGNWSTAPHLDLDLLCDDSAARGSFLAAVKDHGLEISALTANGNQLHPGPEGRDHDRVVRRTIELAGKIGLDRIVLMSGLPGAEGDSHPNWITLTWPPETVAILEYQWREVAIPYWRELTKYAVDHGVTRLALELHGGQLVYNVPSFFRLREAVGETVGVNYDPSHLMWMGADPLAAIDALGEAIFHVHAKDAMISERNRATNSLLDTLPPTRPEIRSWNYVTLGYGRDEAWWKQFCYRLRANGYDDTLSIEHEDVAMSRMEGLRKSVAVLQSAMMVEPSDYTLPDI